MKIRTKIILSFLTLGLIPAAFSIFSLIPIESNLQHIGSFHTASVIKAQEISAGLQGAVQESFAYVISGEESEREDFETWSKVFDEQVEDYRNMAELGAHQEKLEAGLLDSIIAGKRQLVADAEAMFHEYADKGTISHDTFIAYENSIDANVIELASLVAMERAEVEASQRLAINIIQRSETTLWLLALLALAIAVIAGVVLSRVITRPLSELANATIEVATGNLDHKAKVISNDEIGQVAQSFNQMIDSLHEKTASVEELNLEIVNRKKAEQEKLSLERQVQHAQKLESLGVLAGGIAHDFNNLLMGVLGNAELALDELSPMSPVRSNLQEIEKASKRAAELANQMLAYSGKGRFIVEPIDLGELLTEMAHLLEVSISKKAILNYKLADNLPAFDGDATQIRQVIMNLITNASEASGGKSSVVTLSTGIMECDRAYLDAVSDFPQTESGEPLPEGSYVYVEVSDEGCGMSAETIEKIFDPFFTTKFTGRGLGMSAVLGIVRGHGGTIKVYSEVGKGTIFKVLFPASELSAEAISEAKKGQINEKEFRGSGTVLIADDEEAVRSVGEQMLERFGFDVITASDGVEAVALFREHSKQIVCVLLDLTMPRMGGEEVFREIRQLDPNVKVIICSGYNEQDATQRFVGKGLAGFIQKPFTLALLKENLIEVLAP